MKVLQVLVLIGLVCSFSFSIKAQADCRYGLKFFVQDEAGKIIENAKLELVSLDNRLKLPSYVRLIRMDNAYLFTSSAGTTVDGDFQVNISAEGFEIHQQKVNFPVCKIQDFDINLKPLAKEQNISILSGSVYDANGALIIKAKVTAINEKGEKFETLTNDTGIYVLNLPFNLYDTSKSVIDFKIAKYEIIVESEYFEKFIIKDFKFVPSYKGKMNLDFALDLLENDNCGAGGCIPEQLQPIDSSNTKISDKILKQSLEQSPKAKNNKEEK